MTKSGSSGVVNYNEREIRIMNKGGEEGEERGVRRRTNGRVLYACVRDGEQERMGEETLAGGESTRTQQENEEETKRDGGNKHKNEKRRRARGTWRKE